MLEFTHLVYRPSVKEDFYNYTAQFYRTVLCNYQQLNQKIIRTLHTEIINNMIQHLPLSTQR